MWALQLCVTKPPTRSPVPRSRVALSAGHMWHLTVGTDPSSAPLGRLGCSVWAAVRSLTWPFWVQTLSRLFWLCSISINTMCTHIFISKLSWLSAKGMCRHPHKMPAESSHLSLLAFEKADFTCFRHLSYFCYCECWPMCLIIEQGCHSQYVQLERCLLISGSKLIHELTFWL